MKKFIVSILAVLYLATSSGATIHMHYCMGKLADWNFGHQESKTCNKCGMEKEDSKDNGCCKDEQKFLKDDSAQKITESNIQFLQSITATLPSTSFQFDIITFPTLTEKNPNSHAPPINLAVPIFIRNCVFLI